MTDSTLFSNFAAVRGGAIVNNGSLTVVNTTFVGNEASVGGSSGGASTILANSGQGGDCLDTPAVSTRAAST